MKLFLLAQRGFSASLPIAAISWIYQKLKSHLQKLLGWAERGYSWRKGESATPHFHMILLHIYIVRGLNKYSINTNILNLSRIYIRFILIKIK